MKEEENSLMFRIKEEKYFGKLKTRTLDKKEQLYGYWGKRIKRIANNGDGYE